jgi:sulfoxide reductase heme-binding subunit YedZ
MLKRAFSSPSAWLAAAHLGALFPLARLAAEYYLNGLGVNPVQLLTFSTGKAALVLLVLTLAVTPLNTLFGLRQLIPLRRWLGLYAFFYAALHLLTFVAVDYGFDWGLIYEAVFEKRYALVGFSAFLILLPLALTSTKGWQRRLGKFWKRLHQGVYLAAILVIIHYVWLVKSDIRQPLWYGAIVTLLLLARIPAIRRRLSGLRRSARPAEKPAAKLPAEQ